MSDFPVDGSATLKGRVKVLEDQFKTLLTELKQAFDAQGQQMSTSNEVINALVEVVGEADVQVVLEATRKRKRDEFEAKQAAGVIALKDKAIMLPAEVVTEDSTIVTSETYPDGKLLREQYVIARVPNPEAKAQLLGKKVGEEIQISNVKCKIMEIYTFDKARADAVMKEEAEKAKAVSEAETLAKMVSEPTPVAPENASVEA